MLFSKKGGQTMRGAARIRTGDGGFADLCMSGDAPARNQSISSHKQTLAPSLLHDSCQTDPDFALLEAAWPKFSDADRAEIIAKAKAAIGDGT
jgi:hypothetical protein